MASAIEHLISEVTNLIAQRKFVDCTNELNRNYDVLKNNSAHLDTVLATLSPAQHTIAVAFVLKARLSSVKQLNAGQDVPVDTLHATVAEFVSVCDLEQLSVVQDSMCDTLEEYCGLLLTKGCAIRGIEVLRMAILKLQACGTGNTPHHLSGAHPLLLQLCLGAQCLKPALALLDTNIMEINKDSSGITIRHYLLYHYYGGMVYTAMKNYDRAKQYYRLCMSVPAIAVSHIMLEAYKKFVLVSLIKDGKICKLPKCTSMVVPRFIRPLCGPYLELGEVYTNNSQNLLAFIRDNAQTFQRDGNYGLVKQLVTCIFKKNIHNLRKVFLTLSLSDVAHRVKLEHPKSAQEHLLNMIEDDEIFASINQKDGMVDFKDSPECYNDSKTLGLLHQRMKAVMDLEQRLIQMEEAIQLNPSYVSKTLGSSDDISPQNIVPTSSM